MSLDPTSKAFDWRKYWIHARSYKGFTAHDPVPDGATQCRVVLVLCWMQLLHNWEVSRLWKGGRETWSGTKDNGWLIGRGEMRSNGDLLMEEIYGHPRCQCDSCLKREDTAIRDAELAFAGFREYVETCRPPDGPQQPNRYYDLANTYLHSALLRYEPITKEGR